ncbi:MAG TPA: hypothetical protein VNI55_02595 [Gaiellaceae bacterium]|nr:hypothetical protein [Gaiellaceae bacterium]
MRLSRRLAPSLVGLLAVAALLLGFGGTGPGERPPLRVLFVRNSLTVSNDLPAMVVGDVSRRADRLCGPDEDLTGRAAPDGRGGKRQGVADRPGGEDAAALRCGGARPG